MKKQKTREQKGSSHDAELKKVKGSKVSKKKNVKFSASTKANDSLKPQKSNEFRELTAEELSEIQKPENIRNITSKRQRRREKSQQLKLEKKLTGATNAQQKGLNYLSSWKHNRQEWKFEKIKQIWLQRNMFDSAAIPEKSWDVLIEYFSGAKGHIRQAILKECEDIVKKAEKSEDKNADDEKFNRARTLIQHLQE